ncbi:MAG TPA: hypothetical protein VJS92_12710, partial [Candidatus Polarisedimenticolaceae bacterium]|nr:hypothetical protein [Candidatus Polarisedimenticolaceae bacterium]
SVAARAATAEAEPAEDPVARVREVHDLLDRLANFTLVPCACGVRIKLPPAYTRPSIACPRCGREHAVPQAQAQAQAPPQTEIPAPAAPLSYRRQSPGWESFRCACGRTLQLSPQFQAEWITCPACQRKIGIEGG